MYNHAWAGGMIEALFFRSREAWRAWLEVNHAMHMQAWVRIKKNHVSGEGVFYAEAVEEALCFGWIDGAMHSATDDFYHVRFSPRKRGSVWSVSNQKRVEKLIAEGKMAEAGMVKVREAQENGEWEAAMRREDTTNLPDDLIQALERASQVGEMDARASFDKLPASQKKQLLYWIASAKTEMTRQKRIQDVVEKASQNTRSEKDLTGL